MKKIDVTLTIGRTGPNGPENRGDTVKVSVAEAARLLDAGFAETPKKGSAEEKAIAAHRGDLEAEKAQAAKVEAAKAANGKAEKAVKGS